MPPGKEMNEKHSWRRKTRQTRTQHVKKRDNEHRYPHNGPTWSAEDQHTSKVYQVSIRTIYQQANLMTLVPLPDSDRQSSPPSRTNHSGTLTQGDFCGSDSSGGSSNSWVSCSPSSATINQYYRYTLQGPFLSGSSLLGGHLKQ
jgi:hypothetical protein